jgi:hypothetical protein
MWDGQRAIRLVRSRASELGLDPHYIALFGSSAGGHLARTLALHPTGSFGSTAQDNRIDHASAEVELLGLGYPVISMNPSAVPPTGSYNNLITRCEGDTLQRL